MSNASSPLQNKFNQMALKFVSAPGLFPSFSTANDATQQFQLGQHAVDEFGDEWVYVKNGSTSALSRGKICMIKALTSLGAGTITSDTAKLVITYSTAGMTAGAYANQLIYISAGGANGDVRVIRNNDAGTLTLDTALSAALDASSVGNIFSPYIVDLATVSVANMGIIGVAQGAVTASYFGWLKVSGVAEVLGGGAVAVNLAVKVGDNTAGQGIVVANGDDLYDVNIIGHAMVASTAADVGVPVLLNIR